MAARNGGEMATKISSIGRVEFDPAARDVELAAATGGDRTR